MAHTRAAPLLPDSMTSTQLARRARITDVVIRLLEKTDADRIQMRDVAGEAEVALATLYRYFPTKEQLLAAALLDWNRRMSERFRARHVEGLAQLSPRERVLDLFRREMKAYERRPHFARLEVELHTSRDPYVIETLDRRALANRAALFELIPEVAPARARAASIAIGGTLLTALALWTTGRVTFVQALHNVEDVVLLCFDTR